MYDVSLLSPLQQRVVTVFAEQFGQAPSRVFRAPGRVNLIGEHTDYNDGFVLPCAIEFETVAAARLADATSTQLTVYALDYNERHVIDLQTPIANVVQPRWASYVRGVVAGLLERGLTLPAAELVVSGNVPQGAGLSSSASLEMVLGLALSSLAGAPLSARDNALNGQQAEHNYAGCHCGIMDQLVSAAGAAGHALLLDCRSLDYQSVPMPDHLQVLIIHSNVKRGLVDSAYNERRQQCEAAAQYFGVKALRDVTLAQLESDGQGLDAVTYQRARHVISENARTLAAADALRTGDVKTLSHLMAQSHASMRDDFAITVPAIDFLVEEVGHVIGEQGGVRMTGGGFGGCIVALLPENLIDAVVERLTASYPAAFGLQPTFYRCTARQGASEV